MAQSALVDLQGAILTQPKARREYMLSDSAAARLYAARFLSATLSFALWSAARPDQHIRPYIDAPRRTKWLRSHVVPPHHHAATLDSNGPPATKVPPRYRGLTGHVRRCLLSEDMLAARPLLSFSVPPCLPVSVRR